MGCDHGELESDVRIELGPAVKVFEPRSKGKKKPRSTPPTHNPLTHVRLYKKSSYQLIQSLENILALENTQELSASTLRNGHVQICWSQLKSSRQLIQPLERSMALGNRHDTSASTLQGTSEQICSEVSPPCIFVKTGNIAPTEQLISDTYCHPDLVPHITCWVSADFVLKLLMATSLRSTKTNSALCSYNLSRLPNYVKRLFPTC